MPGGTGVFCGGITRRCAQDLHVAPGTAELGISLTMH